MNNCIQLLRGNRNIDTMIITITPFIAYTLHYDTFTTYTKNHQKDDEKPSKETGDYGLYARTHSTPTQQPS